MSHVEDVGRFRVRGDAHRKSRSAREGFRSVLLEWNRARHKKPSIRRILGAAGLPVRAHGSLKPLRIVKVGSLPSPWILRRVELLRRTERVITSPLIAWIRCRRISLVAD